MKAVTLVLFILAVSSISYGHQEQGIKILSNGDLIGFPEEYVPSSIDIESWILNIAENQYEFPTCIKKKFSDIKYDDIFISSSWYHITRQGIPRMPNYMSMRIESKNFKILIALDTAKPFHGFTDKELSEKEICGLLNE